MSVKTFFQKSIVAYTVAMVLPIVVAIGILGSIDGSNRDYVLTFSVWVIYLVAFRHWIFPED